MKIWIDCSNSPHPLLFAPIARELAARGHEVAVTARDHAQTVELAREQWPDVQVVDGRRVSLARAATAVELASRTAALRRWARRARPDVALSHNSYAQIAAARSAGIPVVTAMDYEHQPMNQVAFRLAHRILLPAVFPEQIAKRQGARPSKVTRYDGLKEELYLGDFEPDPEILEKVGVSPGKVLVIARSGATRAAYHGYEDRLFMDALALLGRRSDVNVVVLARHPEHRREIEAIGAPNLIIPLHAVDARSLVRVADAFIGAGGSMTREAALLGTPALSVFGGEEAAVDQWLAEGALLRRLSHATDVNAIASRRSPPRSLDELRSRSRDLIELFVASTLAVADR